MLRENSPSRRRRALAIRSAIAPSPQEIAEEAARIQQSWSLTQRKKRTVAERIDAGSDPVLKAHVRFIQFLIDHAIADQ